MSSIQRLLTAENIRCCMAYALWKLPRLQNATVIIRCKEETVKPLVLGDAFGTYRGKDCRGGAFYMEVVLEVYAPYRVGGQECQNTQKAVALAIKSDWQTLCLRQTEVEPVYYDPDADCYRGDVRLVMQGCILRDDVKGE